MGTPVAMGMPPFKGIMAGGICGKGGMLCPISPAALPTVPSHMMNH